EVVALLLLGADVHQANGRLWPLEDVAGEDAAHDAVLEQVLRLGADVGADVDEDARTLEGGHDGGDAGPADILEEAPEEQTAGDHGAGVAGADDTLDLLLSQQLPATAYGVIGLLAQGDDGTLVHADGLGTVKERQAVTGADAGQERFDLRLVADQQD